MGVMGLLHSVREYLLPSQLRKKSMISYKMLTIVLLVFISHRSVDAIPLPERMLEEGGYLIIPIGGPTFYDNDLQDITVR